MPLMEVPERLLEISNGASVSRCWAAAQGRLLPLSVMGCLEPTQSGHPGGLIQRMGLEVKQPARRSTFWWGNQAGVFCACTIQLLLHVANRQEPRSFLSVDSTQPTVAGTRLGALQPSESASALHCLLGASYTSFSQEDRGCLDPGSILA